MSNIAHVQSRSASGSGTSLALAYSSANAAGNLLVASTTQDSGSSSSDSLSDSAGNRWLQTPTSGVTGNAVVRFWSGAPCLAGANTVTATFTVSQSQTNLGIVEYSADRGWPGSPVAVVRSATGFSISPAVFLPGKTLRSRELIVGVVGIDNAFSITKGGNYDERVNIGNGLQLQDRVVDPGVYFSSQTIGGSASWAAIAATFRPHPDFLFDTSPFAKPKLQDA